VEESQLVVRIKSVQQWSSHLEEGEIPVTSNQILLLHPTVR